MSEQEGRITLSLKGDSIPLDQFAGAMQHFKQLLEALADEVVGESVDWEIAQLQSASATITLVAPGQQSILAQRVAVAYGLVGDALQQNKAIPFSDAVNRPARAITGYINGHINAVHFITDAHTAVVATPVLHADPPAISHSLGVVTGVIETISGRGRLTCTLYDNLFDMAIKCHINERDKERVRNAWGRRVSVTGEVERDPVSGRPTTVRNIQHIQLQDYHARNSYQQLRGIVGWIVGDEPSETQIRQMRDVE